MSGNSKYAIVTAILWGINFPLVNGILSDVNENTLLVIRFSLAPVLFTAYLFAHGESLRIRREHMSHLFLGTRGYNAPVHFKP